MLTYFDKLTTHLPEGVSLETFTGNSRPDLLLQIEALRVSVWRATGFTIKPELAEQTHWGDEWDSKCQHWVLLKDSKVIAATRASVHPSVAESPYPEWFRELSTRQGYPVIYSSRLVVDPSYQRQGLGDFLDKQCVEFGRTENASAILVDVPEYRIEPLLRRGFQLTSEPILGILFPTMRFSGMVLKLEG